MPLLSALFLVLSLALAMVMGPQTLPWSWGPSMLALGAATLTALPAFWKSVKAQSDIGLLGLCLAVASWFAWRAWTSPVRELGLADLFLLCGATGAFVSIRAITGDARAERVVIWGIALLLLANVVVVAKQVFTPPFSPFFPISADGPTVSGFYAHYNHLANFLIGSSMLVGAAALFGRHATVTRLLFAVLAIAGLAGVYFTKSRGGIFGAALGCGVFLAIALTIAKRSDSKWFAPGLLAIPLLGMAVTAFWMFGWEQRSGGDTLGLLDNTIRLYLVGIAISCVGLHPFAGGGSQSFSWESFQFFDSKNQRHGGHRPELVHNELMQAATDYGLVGAGLLILLLLALFLGCILRVAFEDRPREADWRDVWRLGAMAAFAGMFVQSSFSFVFHLMPDVIILGICLGMMSRGEAAGHRLASRTSSAVLSLTALASALVLIPAGWKGTRIYQVMAPVLLGKVPDSSGETHIDLLSEAIRIWPLSDFHQERAAHRLAFAARLRGIEKTEAIKLALEDYLGAEKLHPYEPSHAINAANLQSMLGMNEKAEASYIRGIRLQGGMESGFRGHFSKAKHHLARGVRLYDSDNPAAALAEFKVAAEEMEKSCEEMHWLIGDMNKPRMLIHTYLGSVHDLLGNDADALASYDFLSTLEKGQHGHYLASLVIGKMAVEAWNERKPEKALGGFIEARRRMQMAGGRLPDGVTEADRNTYTAFLDERISFLQGAKYNPAPWQQPY